MYTPENKYIKKIDASIMPTIDLGKEAEGVVIDFFNTYFPGRLRVRPATPAEDSGVKQIMQGKQIDAVAYDDHDEVALCMQITTAKDPNIRKEKLKQLMERPFVRLDEARSAVPKVIVNLDQAEVALILKDHDFSKHPKMFSQILNSVIQSLKFVLNRTEIKEQQKTILGFIKIFEDKLAKPN